MRHVRDAEFWGLPVGTPIKPGMKPTPKPKPGRRYTNPVGTPIRRIAPPSKPTSKPTTKPTSTDALKLRMDDAANRVMGARTADELAKAKEDYRKAKEDYLKVNPQSQIIPKKTSSPKKPDAPSPAPDTNVDTKVRDNKDFSIESSALELKKISRTGRKDGAGSLEDPIDCGDDIKKAHQLLGEGKHIRLNTSREVSLLIDQLAEEAAFKKESGEAIPDYDLCKVTVPDTNLFCLESKGIPRAQMPQFSGQAVTDSYAASRVDPKKNEANITDEFGQLLDTMGISIEEKDVPVQELKATQSQLVGSKVAGMRQAMRDGKIKDEPIYVTRDGYIVDGHHRWAAKMALDLEDGKLGDVDMPVKMIDADIGYILDLSNGFAEMAGIKPKGTGAAAEGVKAALARASRLGGAIPHHACQDGTCGMTLTEHYLSKVAAFLDECED